MTAAPPVAGRAHGGGAVPEGYTRGNGLNDRLRSGGARRAAWLTLRDPLAAEAVARSGVDLVVIDAQHGGIEASDLLPLLQATQPFAPALVRLLAPEPTLVTRALDLGADGVIAPLVNDARTARALVAAARYPGAGTRSYGPIRAALRHGAAYREEVAEHALVIAMIETREGLAAVDEIAAVEGLNGLFVGPADLGLALGVGPQTDRSDPSYLAARARVIAAAHAHGLSVGLHGDDPVMQRAALDAGIDWVVIGTDLRAISEVMAHRLRFFG
jgi:4-hydroxy-2-oxoheptanedioate aldolase